MNFDIPILILARAGSKRIKNKNLSKINGKSIVCLAVEKSLKITSNVYVSSDSEEILNTCKILGAKTIKRPAEISGDHASSISGVVHFFQESGHNTVCLLQATCPLIKTEHIKSGISKYIEGDFDSVVSGTKEKI